MNNTAVEAAALIMGYVLDFIYNAFPELQESNQKHCRNSQLCHLFKDGLDNMCIIICVESQ